MTTLGGLLSGVLVYTFAPEAEGHGTDAAVEAFHFKGGRVRPIVPLIKVFASAITIGSGGAADAKDRPRKSASASARCSPTCCVCRTTSGESWFLPEWLLDLPQFPVPFRNGHLFGGNSLFGHGLRNRSPHLYRRRFGRGLRGKRIVRRLVADFSLSANRSFHAAHRACRLSYTRVVAGIVGAIEPPIFMASRLFHAVKIPNRIKPAIGGLLMGLVAIFVPETISTGYGWVQKAMTGDYIGWSLILLAVAKIVAMSLTISSGGSGGVFGPNVYIGGMVGAWVAFVADRFIPGAGFNPAAFAVVGMAPVCAGTARVPIATLIMVAEMTGGYGLIVPSMFATIIAFVVERTVSSGFKYPRLYEAQVELRSDSPTHLESMLKATFAVLERGPLVDLRNVTLPHLASLLRHGTPIPIHDGQGCDDSKLARRFTIRRPKHRGRYRSISRVGGGSDNP